MASLNEWAYTQEERDLLEEEQNLDNQIYLEKEIDGQVVLVKALEQRFEDLANLKAAILKAGGMTRTLANEAEVILPEITKGRKPTEYSSIPTATGLKEALEEINIGLAAAVAAGVTAVVAMIYKFIKWLTGDSSSSGGGSVTETMEKAEKAKEDIPLLVNKVAEATEDVGKLFDKGITLTHKEEDKTITIRGLRDLISYLKENGDERTVDMLKMEDNGRLTPTSIDFGGSAKVTEHLLKVSPTIKDAINQFDKTADYVGKFADTLHSKVTSSRMITAESVQDLSNQARQVSKFITDEPLGKLKEYKEGIEKVMDELPAAFDGNIFEYTKNVGRNVDKFEKLLNFYISMLGTLSEGFLNSYISRMEDIGKEVTDIDASDENGEAALSMVKRFTGEVMRTTTTVLAIYNRYNMIANEYVKAVNYCEKCLLAITHALRHGDYAVDDDDWEAINNAIDKVLGLRDKYSIYTVMKQYFRH